MEQLTSTKSVRIALLVLLVIGSLFLAVHTVAALGGWHHGKMGEDMPKISVTGSGDAFVIPTTATFSFSVIQTAPQVKDAQAKATEQMNKAIDYLKNAGIPEKNIKTTGYNVNPQYTYNNRVCITAPCQSNQTLTGYEVSQTIEVKVADQSKAGDILAGIGNLGVQNISGISFTVEDDNAIQQEARQMAIEDAKAKAEVLAQDLGVHLGKIVDFQESTGGAIPYYAKAMDLQSAAGNAAPELPVGQNKVTSNVTITYSIR